MNGQETYLRKNLLSVTGYVLCLPVQVPFGCASPYIAFVSACASRYAGHAYAEFLRTKSARADCASRYAEPIREAVLYRYV